MNFVTKEQAEEYIGDTARMFATIDFLGEICGKLGISDTQFRHVLQQKVAYYRLFYLKRIEDTQPSLAALLNREFSDEILLADESPKLFPPTSPQ